jgi:hypothetical protein
MLAAFKVWSSPTKEDESEDKSEDESEDESVTRCLPPNETGITLDGAVFRHHTSPTSTPAAPGT